MSRWSPCKRKDVMTKLKKLGYTGPYPGGNHEYLIRNTNRLTLFSNTEFSVNQIRLLLREASAHVGRKIELEEWVNL
ncbi:MAG: type II toxin-antitoxin system HicA family toxin [Ignavibacteriota bacterium]